MKFKRKGYTVKKALLVGINKYKMSGCDLQGCVNDVVMMQQLLQLFKFNNVKCLLDKSATKVNIINELGAMISGSKPGDEILYYHSGHGTQVYDLNNDEADGWDECLVPYNHNWNSPFTDDILAQCLKPLNKTACLSLIIDTCHSGTITDLSVPDAPKRRQAIIRGIVPPAKMLKRAKTNKKRTLFGVKNSSPTTQRHLLLAGCKEDEYSYEDYFGKQVGGVLTQMFFKVVKNNIRAKVTWNQMFPRIYNKVHGNTQGEQHPVLMVGGNLADRYIFGGK